MRAQPAGWGTRLASGLRVGDKISWRAQACRVALGLGPSARLRHRRTVRSTLISAAPPSRKLPPPRVSPALDPRKPLIGSWVETNKDMPKKQRHARRVYECLVEEYGADLGESTVCPVTS